MAISYDKLWKLLIDKKMNRSELKAISGISFNSLAKLGKNEKVSMTTLQKICKSLNCSVSDIFEFTEDKDTSKER